MKRLWTPWRMKYLEGEQPKGCVFCQKIKSDKDRENHILYRGKHACIVLNLYPYNTGHMMVIPYAHVSEPRDMDKESQLEMLFLVNKALEALQRAMQPEGFNIGVNLGAAAGAGIGEHLHVHIVPRWGGDTNFMTICAETRVVPEMLEDTYDKLKPLFDDIMTRGGEA